jgi:uncharacterized protein YciI
MTQFLYRIRPTRPEMLSEGPTPQESEVVEAHFVYLKDLAARGVVHLAGRTLTTDENSFGIVIFRAENEDAARTIMNRDPAVQNGVMRSELFPYRIAVWSPPEP